MIPVHVQHLIMSRGSGPSILVLCPNQENDEPPARFIPIWIGLPEAAQIGLALEDIKLPRPLTHDLFLDALTNLDTYIDHILITDVKTSTFFAKIVLRHHGRLIELDARPSDAVALAVKQGADMFVLEPLMNKASYPFNQVPNDETDLESFREFVEHLSPDDFQ